MSEDQVRILIVEARFYSDLADELLKGAQDALEAFGAAYDVVTVPGALEIPAAIAIAEEGGRYDGYVALGTVILSARGISALIMRITWQSWRTVRDRHIHTHAR